jgi:hypothetical protein
VRGVYFAKLKSGEGRGGGKRGEENEGGIKDKKEGGRQRTVASTKGLK